MSQGALCLEELLRRTLTGGSWLFPARIQQPAGNEASSWYDFACMLETVNEGGLLKEAPRENGKDGVGGGNTSLEWQVVVEGFRDRKSGVDIPLYHSLQLKLKLKNPWEEAKGQRKKNLWIFTPLEQAESDLQGTSWYLNHLGAGGHCSGQSLPAPPPHTVRRKRRASWCTPAGLVPVGSRIVAGGSSHAFHMGKY